MNPETELGGRARAFPTTAFSVFRLLREGDAAERGGALHRLVALYWKSVYCLIRYGWHKNNEDAKDLTQEFFLDVVFQGSLAEKYSPERGGFRGFLKASVTNFMRDEAKAAGRIKRGGEVTTLSLDIGEVDVDAMVADSGVSTPEQVFDVAWRHSVMSKAVLVVSNRFRAEGKEEIFEIFRLYDLDPVGGNLSYGEMAKKLGTTPDKVKHALTTARQELRRAVLETIAEYVESEEEIRREMAELFGA